MKPYTVEVNKVLEELASKEDGLSSSKAKELIEIYGENKLNEEKNESTIKKFVKQFKDTMIIILLIACAISFFIAVAEKNPSEFVEPILILVIVVLNATMGVIQENKAEKSLESLKSLSAPQAKVIRDNKQIVIDASKIVKGDVIILEAGDIIPADCRLINSFSLKCDESILTGESVSVDKKANILIKEDSPIGDRINMLYSGCIITYGHGSAVVISTGMDTEIGKISNLLNQCKTNNTPLQNKLSKLGKTLGIMALCICIIIFIISIFDNMPIKEMFMTAVSLAVAAIPEGLPVIVTIVLALGVEKMAKKNAIIRNLPAVETLGSTSVICSDKTGTLTQNKMTVLKVYDKKSEKIEDVSSDNSTDIKNILKYATLCCDGNIRYENNKEIHIGDPTETSIIVAALKNKIIKNELEKENQRIGELPFDSDRKLMSTVNIIDGKKVVITKGAFEMLSKICIDDDFYNTNEKVKSFSEDGLRVLGIAYKEIDTLKEEYSNDELESNLNFMGLIAMIDPPREEAKKAVETCVNSGIKPVMITGDNIITARAIAKQVGIYKEGDKCITGEELLRISDEELKEEVENISVYARVSPEDKIRIVKAWQSKNMIVSMTGDGVNDAPALKAADIGCSMGITGTDVAKSAADMILTDDNFATIVYAVKQGRGIYENIKKTIGYLLGTNIGEIFVVFFAILLYKNSPLLSMQLLWINLVTDSLPAIALGMEPIDDDIMNEKPRPKDEGIFSNGLGVRVILQGIMFGCLALWGFKMGWSETGDISSGRTMAFLIMAFSQVIHAFNMRSMKSIFKIGVFKNKYLNIAALISIILVCFIAFIPQLASLFKLTILSSSLYIKAILISFIPLIILEISKALKLIK